MRTAAIIHGTKGSSTGNWFQDVASQLRERGVSAIVPDFPTPHGQSLANWLVHFDRAVGLLDQNSILVGHSVGAVCALRILERLAVGKRYIHTAVLVAGFTGSLGLPEYDALNSSFVAAPFDWTGIRSSAAHIVCLSGENDPYVPFAQGQQIAQSLGVEHIVIPGGGHLNAEFGYTSFPRLIEELKKTGAV
ncbi:MAG: serine hydrolase family protein [Proteobacteria bacterium]|nr:serine hydrolase family protein [Pseudomonadota bacterium]